MIFCQTDISAGHLSVAFLVFCIPCGLRTPNLAFFKKYIQMSSSYDKKCGIILKETSETYFVQIWGLHYHVAML